MCIIGCAICWCNEQDAGVCYFWLWPVLEARPDRRGEGAAVPGGSCSDYRGMEGIAERGGRRRTGTQVLTYRVVTLLILYSVAQCLAHSTDPATDAQLTLASFAYRQPTNFIAFCRRPNSCKQINCCFKQNYKRWVESNALANLGLWNDIVTTAPNRITFKEAS